MSRLLDWLLGPRCPRCSNRVFPRDAIGHRIQHFSRENQ